MQLFLLFRSARLNFFAGFCFLIAGILSFMVSLNYFQKEIVIVLTFHGVTDHPSKPWEIDYKNLKRYLHDFKLYGYKPMDPSHFENWRAGRIPSGKHFMVTFDDGLKASVQGIRRLKDEENINSALFIVTDLLGQPDFVDQETLRGLASMGCLIGLHGKTHESPVSIFEDKRDLLGQLSQAKEDLQRITGKPVTWYAYPYGDFNEAVSEVVASTGVKFAFTIKANRMSKDDNPFQIPRVMYYKNAEEAGEPTIEENLPPFEQKIGEFFFIVAVIFFILGAKIFLGARKNCTTDQADSSHCQELPSDNV